MAAEIDLPLEGLEAQFAGERFQTGMFPRVCDEVAGLTESLAAMTTDVRLLTWNERRWERRNRRMSYTPWSKMAVTHNWHF